MSAAGVRRRLYAKATLVTFTQTTTDREIDRLWLRVELRAAELGLTLTAVAGRMGISRTRLTKGCGRAQIPRAWFARLSAALEMAPLDWCRELRAAPRVSAEKMQRLLRAKLR